MEWKQRMKQYTPQAIQFRRALHEHPELSGNEYQTTQQIRRELNRCEIPILDEFKLDTGLVAEIHGCAPGVEKTVAIRADIDALPIREETGLPFASQISGISHACGHDLHTAALLLCARVLQEEKKHFSGTVRLLFQPSEENGNGARTMIQAGVMRRPTPVDLVLGLHTWPDTPAGMIGVRYGASHASSDTIVIRVKGVGGHGAHPYRCVDPIVASAYLLTQLQSVVSRELPMVESGVLTFGMINGGTAPNVIPDEVILKGTLRTLDPKWRENMIHSIHRISASCCEAMRATAEVTVEEGMPVLMNTNSVIDGLRSSAGTALGAENVQLLSSASPGSDDFSCYLAHAPGALFRIGTGNEDSNTHIGLHNGRNCFDERAIPTGAAVLVQYVLDVLGGNISR